jgi:NAD(P)-dependent dehydrogenase (short-subunit alcohol dehydrogenase family)
MTDSVCVVTGGAGGLGELVALAAARRHRVIVVDADESAGERMLRDLGDRAAPVGFVHADLTDPDSVRGAVRAATDAGELRVWVNCAGAWSRGEQFPHGEEWRRTLALDLETPMLATQLCLAPMSRAGGGAVVNVASSAGLGDAGYASPEYAAAKAGLIRFTTAVAGLGETHRVRVSCVVPHWIGLPRAYDEWAALSEEERAASGGLVPAQVVVDTALSLAEDPRSAGRVVELRGRPVTGSS